MSTFGGRIEELENVLVDNFLSYKSSTSFFLSHCHADHMTGLDQLLLSIKDSSSQYLYCSPISRLILLNKYAFADGDSIKELTATKVITVPGNAVAPSYQVTVTPVPAGHCPGSIMFLFEAINTTILYTGDFRIHKDDISKFRSFHCRNAVKPIDKLYFDSTFLNKTFWHFPLRSEVVTELIKLTTNWLKKSPQHNVLLETSALYGYEFVFVELARKLKWKIHVKESLFDLFWNVPEVGFFLTKDCNSTKIHSAGIFDKKCLPCDGEKLLRIRLSAQWYKSPEGTTRDKMWEKLSKRKILMCYSTHCSCSELMDFLNYLQPKGLEPCSVPVGSTRKETESFIMELMSPWSISQRRRSPEPENCFPMERHYKFRVKFPQQEEESSEDLMETSRQKRQKLLHCNEPTSKCTSKAVDGV